ncbi:MAG: alkaline phosphatase family protein [Stellaceae bacterium]
MSSVALYAMAVNTMAPLAAVAADTGANDGNTATPIKHVIVIIGENRSFDHMFATYVPKNKGETVFNLLSEGIVKADGTPGANYTKAPQVTAQDRAPNPYLLSPPGQTPYKTLPPPLAGGGPPPFSSVSEALTYENGLPSGYYKYLTTGAVPSYLSGKPDMRIYYDGNSVDSLPPGPYQLTNTTNPTGPTLTADDYAESPVHRFYQMWQQLNCTAAAGCQNTLFPWVEATVGAGSNGKPPPADFTYKEGAASMGFYNIQQGDLPYFKTLADTYSMSDNYHQAVNGGTGANHIMLGTGDAVWFSDGNGNPLTPPHNMKIAAGSPNAGVVDEVENPNPLKGTNNWYTEDGYGGGSYGSPSYGGGSYSDCADTSQPGVKTITDYLKAEKVKRNCQAGHYYLLNNYNPGYYGDGTNAYADIKNPYNTVFTVPPSSVRNIGDALLKKNITFAWFGDQFNAYLANPYNNYVTADNQYCNICNFFQYSTSIMTNPPVRKMALQDTLDLYNDLMTCTAKSCGLPAVSFVKPDGYLDGHPASSKPDLLAGFIKKIVDMTKANSTLWANTAIMITMDEGGGYYDSGYVQPLDYFGDGTRIPMIVVSKYSAGGNISHTYTDHVSVLKFIEANWNVPPITKRSRDNLPNPVAGADPYKPTNGPAIGNLMDLFKFPKS